MTMRRFPIRFTGIFRPQLAFCGIRPRSSYVDLGADEVRVHMGWAFDMTVLRQSIRSAAEDHDRVLGWGVHNWRGQWLVNGSSSGIVHVEIDPPGRATVIVLRVSVRVLRVAVEDPDELIAALSA